LALALGKTVAQMLAEVSSLELTEWLAYYRLEPFGEGVADQRHGGLSALLANIHRDAKTKPDPFRPTDFIPWHPVHRTPQTPILFADPEAQSQALVRALFGKR
jgi:hypothetical protein